MKEEDRKEAEIVKKRDLKGDRWVEREVGGTELGVDRVHFPSNAKEGAKLLRVRVDLRLRQSAVPQVAEAAAEHCRLGRPPTQPFYQLPVGTKAGEGRWR